MRPLNCYCDSCKLTDRKSPKGGLGNRPKPQPPRARRRPPRTKGGLRAQRRYLSTKTRHLEDEFRRWRMNYKEFLRSIGMPDCDEFE